MLSWLSASNWPWISFDNVVAQLKVGNHDVDFSTIGIRYLHYVADGQIVIPEFLKLGEGVWEVSKPVQKESVIVGTMIKYRDHNGV